MTTKHTPGPWRVIPSNGMAFDEWLVEVASDEFLTPGIAEVYEEADARLIAAAPDLLAACQMFVEVYTDAGQHARIRTAKDLAGSSKWGGFGLYVDAMQLARAAIAKAKGEKP